MLDPGQALDARLDVGIRGGTITAIATGLRAGAATRVIDASAPRRFVLPGLVNLHTHVAYGATTAGVGRIWGDPDLVGVRSGVTTEVDAGSTGVSNIGVFAAHILPNASTRVVCYVNVSTYAHTRADTADVLRLEDVDERAIAACVETNPGLVSGLKLRLVGPLMDEHGEEIVTRSLEIADRHRIPLMVHIGDSRRADRDRPRALTRFLLGRLRPGDIVTHYSTPHPGSVLDETGEPLPELRAARERGVVFDACTGRHQFGFDTARRQAELGLHPDTISTDAAASGRTMVSSLVEVMAKYMAVGYTFEDVVRMATVNAARAADVADRAGTVAVGREADITIVDVVEGRWTLVDQLQRIPVAWAVVPAITLRAGTPVAPATGPYRAGWLPDEAQDAVR